MINRNLPSTMHWALVGRRFWWQRGSPCEWLRSNGWCCLSDSNILSSSSGIHQIDEAGLEAPENTEELNINDGMSQFIVELIWVNFLKETSQEPGARPHRKCDLTTVVWEIMANQICAEEECETVIEDHDLLWCGACNLVVSNCMLLFRKKYRINTNIIAVSLDLSWSCWKARWRWFCDDECKANAGGTVSTCKRWRRV